MVLQAVIADEPRTCAPIRISRPWRTRGVICARAESLARHAVAIDPNYFDAWNTLGAIFVLEKRPSDAVQALQTALALNPKSGQAHYNLSLALALGGDPQVAGGRSCPSLQAGSRLLPVNKYSATPAPGPAPLDQMFNLVSANRRVQLVSSLLAVALGHHETVAVTRDNRLLVQAHWLVRPAGGHQAEPGVPLPGGEPTSRGRSSRH